MQSITNTQVPIKWDSNIVPSSMKSIVITIKQWNQLPVLKYPYKWDSNTVSSNIKSVAITFKNKILYQY